MTDQEAVMLIQSLEPVFYEAGQLAVDLQAKATKSMKADTGRAAVDIVTSADLEVQEFVLKRLATTALSECKLFAEEDTPSVTQFNPNGELILSLDPIGGTIRYAAGKPLFSVNLALRRGAEFLYTYKHHPAVGWTVVIVNQRLEVRGMPPTARLPNDVDRFISYAYGDPTAKTPALVDELTDAGYQFRPGRSITEDAGATDLLLMGRSGGFYIEQPNAYDGFIGLHFAQATRLQMFDHVDWTAPYLDEKTWRYPGYYIVLNRPANRIDKV